MIPPCDPTVLKSNPQFEKLYQQLTTTLLNADGSTRANDTQPARRAVQEVRLLVLLLPCVCLCANTLCHSGGILTTFVFVLNVTGFEELSITTRKTTDCETDIEAIGV